jgi:hypothetical protein
MEEVEMGNIDDNNNQENNYSNDNNNFQQLPAEPNVDSNNQVNSDQAAKEVVPGIKKKRGNFLLRQELKSYTPECNPTCGIIFNIVTLLVFAGLGVPMIIFSESVKEYQIDYTKWYYII